MVKHNNASIAIDAARILATKGDFLLDEVDGPVAVIPIERYSNIIFLTNGTTSASSNTAGTAASDKDTYITGCSLAIIKDATCDVADGVVAARITVEGVIKNVLTLPVLTLTAQATQLSIAFRYPIKVDRGSALQVVQGTYTAGKFLRSIVFHGYTVETTN